MRPLWLIGLAVLAFLAPSNGDQSCISNTIYRDMEWDLQCSTFRVKLTRVKVEKTSEIELQVRCTNKPDFNLLQTITNLPNLSASKIDNLSYYYCPMPYGNQSLVDVLAGFIEREQVSNIKKLLFVENTKYSEPLPLEPVLFDDLNELEVLSMKRSAARPLDNDQLFASLAKLHTLDLREGDGGSRVATALLRPLANLTNLELMENGLSELPAGLVSSLPNLQYLTLYNNELKRLDKFVELPKLNDIDLSSNQLTELQSDVFDSLPALSQLLLNYNHLSSLPSGLLKNNFNLTIFSAQEQHNERLVLGDGLFAGLKKLSKVYLAQCRIDRLPEDLFAGATGLKTLDLSNNLLQSLPDKLFQDTEQLENLNLGHNMLTTLNDKLLKSKSMLKELYLDHNQLHEIDWHTFNDQSSLRKLILNHNRVALHVNGTPVVYQNGETLVVDQTPFNTLENVMILDLSHNEIITLFQDFTKFMPKLTELNLSHNRISQLSDINFRFASRAINVINLQSNNITRLDFQAENFTDRLPPNILLNGNPLNCDCLFYPLVQSIRAKGYTEITSPFKGALCANPPALAYHALYDVAPVELICQLDAANNFCPTECTCYKRPARSEIIVNCSDRNLTVAPAILSPSVLDDRYDVIELNLANNMLRALPTMGEGWNSVRQLYVANNNLTTLPYDNLPDRLELIDTRGNQMSKFDVQLVAMLANRTELRSISLSANPWKCECDEPLLQFVADNVARITDFTELRCADGEPLNSGTQKKLCNYRTILIVVLCLTVTCLAVAAFICYWLYTRYQHEIKVWLFRHDRLRWLVAEAQIDQDKRYDAFISYSHKDEDFIVSTLMPKLEGEPMNFKLCWHVRDFMPGELISSQITKAVEESRRTIIVLSPNYIESVWGQMEFNTAYLQSVADKRNRVIPIIYEDIGNIDTLDAELRAYLKTNTYVRWDDPWFWDKLRYAMPHPYRLKGVQASNNIRMASVDKLNLLQTATQMSTPSLESTPPIETTHSGKNIPNGEPLDRFNEQSIHKTVSPFTISNGKFELSA